jgi:hypothetical protein
MKLIRALKVALQWRITEHEIVQMEAWVSLPWFFLLY